METGHNGSTNAHVPRPVQSLSNSVEYARQWAEMMLGGRGGLTKEEVAGARVEVYEIREVLVSTYRIKEKEGEKEAADETRGC